MEFRGKIYNTWVEWQDAEFLAHETLENLDNYTSNKYQSSAIETVDNKFILVELKGFESELKDAGFNFVKLNKSIIKQEQI